MGERKREREKEKEKERERERERERYTQWHLYVSAALHAAGQRPGLQASPQG